MTKVAVCIPCHNEELTIESVIGEVRRKIKDSIIFVADNASTDNTAKIAEKNGATVLVVSQKGKGNAIRRLFQTANADIYVMVDGDGTYNLDCLPKMIEMVEKRDYDVVLGKRISNHDNAYRRGHIFGNKIITKVETLLNGRNRKFGAITDSLTGLRVMSRPFVESLPVHSTGFEIEVELNKHANILNSNVAEVLIEYSARPENSVSKLNSFQDGLRILGKMFSLAFYFNPLLIFLPLALFSFLVSALLGAKPVIQFFSEGIVTYMPRLIAATGFFVVAILLSSMGAIAQLLTHSRKEVRMLRFLGSNRFKTF